MKPPEYPPPSILELTFDFFVYLMAAIGFTGTSAMAAGYLWGHFVK